MVACIDYRFVESVHGFLSAEGLKGAADVLSWPGGRTGSDDSDREVLLQAIGQARALHQPEVAILTVHHDCGRIGGSASFARREVEVFTLEAALRIAAAEVAERFPGLQVRLVRFDHRSAVVVGSALSRMKGWQE